jgi:hypothetical protein
VRQHVSGFKWVTKMQTHFDYHCRMFSYHGYYDSVDMVLCPFTPKRKYSITYKHTQLFI